MRFDAPTRRATWAVTAMAGCLLIAVLAAYHSLSRPSPGDEARATAVKLSGLRRAEHASAREAGEEFLSAPEPPVDEMVGEARRRLVELVGRSALVRFHQAEVADVEQRIVCGTVSLRVDEDSTSIVRYVAFGGSGIVVIDDSSPAFVEIQASACGGA